MTIANDTRFDDLKATARKLGGQDGTGQLARISLAMHVLNAAADGVIDPFAKLAKGEVSPVSVIASNYFASLVTKLDGVDGDKRGSIKTMADKLNTFAKLGCTRTFDPRKVMDAAVAALKAAGVSPSLENLVTFNRAQNQSATPLEAAAIVGLFVKAERPKAEKPAPADAGEPVESADPEVTALTRSLYELRKAPQRPETITAIAVLSGLLEKLTAPKSDVVQAIKAEAAEEAARAQAEAIDAACLVARNEGNAEGIAEGIATERSNAEVRAARLSAAATAVRNPVQAPTDDEFDALMAEFAGKGSTANLLDL